jgi:hypothetical protein
MHGGIFDLAEVLASITEELSSLAIRYRTTFSECDHSNNSSLIGLSSNGSHDISEVFLRIVTP